jgi:hypothetical protein
MPKVQPRHTVYDGMYFEDYEYREFPMQLLKGDAKKPDHLVVNDKAELEAALKVGWVKKPEELVKPESKLKI